MRLVAVALLAAVELGGAFGLASATVDRIDARSMVIELSVEVTVTVQAVVAHLSFDTEEPRVIPLLDRGGGVFGIRTELEPKNYVVSFEAVGSNMAPSQPKTLVELGADMSSDTPSVTSPPDSGMSPETRRLGWLAAALAAASLSALAFWALGGSDEREDADEEE